MRPSPHSKSVPAKYRSRQRTGIRSIDVPLAKWEIKTENGDQWDHPMETWGFLRQGKMRSTPVNIAKRFIRVNQEHLGLENVFAPKEENDPMLQYVKTIRGLAGYHVLFRQVIYHRRKKRPLHRAFVTIHMNKKKQIYMCKSRAMPKSLLKKTYLKTREEKKSKVVNQVLEWILEENRSKASPDIPFGPPYPVKRENLTVGDTKLYYKYDEDDRCAYLCWCVSVSRIAPKEEWLIYVLANGMFYFADKSSIAHGPKKHNQRFRSTGKAFVFDPNPVTTLRGHEKLIQQDLLADPQVSGRELQGRLRTPPQSVYKEVTLYALDGTGYLNGKRVQTRTPKRYPRINRPDRDFRVWSRVPGSQHPTGFEEVMVYYHVNEGLRYLETLGYRGDDALFKKPLIANVCVTDEDEAWYNKTRRQLYFGTGEISDAEDGETIMHELGHAIQDHLCRRFGQTNESQAMGEGFADYFAMSFFADKKSRAYRKTVMSWDGLAIGLKSHIVPPALRTINKSVEDLNYNKFIHEEGNHHSNGSIWAATLWDIYKTFGRFRADRIILESHFELSSHATFSRGARAIIHANRNMYDGEGELKLKRIFRRRKIDCGY